MTTTISTTALALPSASSATASDYRKVDTEHAAIVKLAVSAGDLRELSSQLQRRYEDLSDWMGVFCLTNPLANPRLR